MRQLTLAYSALASLGGAVLGTRLSIWLAPRLGLMDRPGGIHTHQVLTPRFGGLGLVAGLLCAWPFLGPAAYTVALSALAFAVVGGVDDSISLTPRQKMLGLMAGALMMAFMAYRDSGEVISAALVFLVAVGLSNAVNLMDGMDGLVGSISAISFGGFAILGVIWRDAVLMALGVAMLAACAGFLLYNWRPARTFMGDAGSLFLGSVMAVLALRAFQTRGMLGLAAAGLAVMLPAWDTASVIVYRLAAGRNPGAGGRDHTYDTITGFSLDSQTTVIVMAALAAYGVGMGIWTAVSRRYLGLCLTLPLMAGLSILLHPPTDGRDATRGLGS